MTTPSSNPVAMKTAFIICDVTFCGWFHHDGRNLVFETAAEALAYPGLARGHGFKARPMQMRNPDFIKYT